MRKFKRDLQNIPIIFKQDRLNRPFIFRFVFRFLLYQNPGYINIYMLIDSDFGKSKSVFKSGEATSQFPKF